MAASVIGALRVVLGADTASFEDGLKKASTELNKFGAFASKAGILAGAALAGMAAGLGVAVKKTIDSADELGKTAQKIGIPVEELSALKHAADLSGIGIEQLSVGIGKLSKNMIEAAAKPTSEAAAAFESLGVKVTNSNGTLKTSTEVISEIAGAFEGLKDGAGKTAVSMAIFGKSGKDLIPLLNSGKDGLQEMKDEAAKLGIIISTKTAKSAEAFNDNLTRLGKVKDAIILKLTEYLLPGLERLSASFVQLAKDGNLAATTGSVIGSFLSGLALEIDKTTLSMETAAKERAAFGVAMRAPLFTAEGKKAWQDYFATLEESKQRMKDLIDGVDTFARRFDVATGSLKPLKKAQEDYNYQAAAGKNALDGFITSQTKSIAGQQAELRSIGMAAGARESLKVQLEADTIAKENNIKVTDAYRLKIDAAAAAAGNMALKLQGAQLVQANLSPIEAYNQELANTELAMLKVNATSDQMARAQEKIKEKFGESAEAIGLAMANIAGSISGLLGTLGKENKAIGIASKAFGIAQVIINTEIAAMKALATLGPIGGPIAAAVAYAAGAASIATIAAQGFAHGGSFRVGGSGGMDSQLMQFMATPGEMVEVKTPGQQSSGGSDRSQGGTEITLRARRLTDMLTLDDLRGLVDGLNNAHRDGYKLKIAAA